MPSFTYHSHDQQFRISIVTPAQALTKVTASPGMESQMNAVRSMMADHESRFEELGNLTAEPFLVPQKKAAGVSLVATETLVVEGASLVTLRKLKSKFGMEVLREGTFEKLLLRNSNLAGEDAIKNAFECANFAYEQTQASGAHPNFVRLMEHTFRKSQSSPESVSPLPWWNHLNNGLIGVRGADSSARAAWTITRGHPDIRVAVLDEGVDVNHPDLRDSVVAQKDFVDNHATAAPNGDDAHGTACSGIIVGRGNEYPGMTQCSLVAVRIAKGYGNGYWAFDDFKTAEAIDWSWNDAKADVLSNSWGGGLAVDAITNAFERARKKGRNNKGAVIAIAAGNSDGPVQYPASLPNMLCVGASNEWDERKSKTSRDHETWWGSCFGPEMQIVAPGVHIATTDISGSAGYGSGNYVLTFNGTSSATPQVAAAAALILSVAPGLKEAEVRQILTSEAAKMKGNGKLDPNRRWNKEMGWGRLDIHAALRRALHS